jgi:hypothetical protein
MSDVQITLTLPEELAERLRAAGLLDSERIARWIEQRLDLEQQSHIQNLLNMAEQIDQVEPKLTLEEIEAEIEVGRQEHYDKRHK